MQEMSSGEIPSARKRMVAPYSITTLIFGILSLGLLFYFGWAFAIITWVLYSKGIRIYEASPEKYTEGSLKMYRLGRKFSIAGFIVSLVSLALILYFHF
jgi:hypothetical protein